MPLPAILAGLARAATAAAQAAARGMAAMARGASTAAQAGVGAAGRAYNAAGGVRGMVATGAVQLMNSGGVSGIAQDTSRLFSSGPNGVSSAAQLARDFAQSGIQGGVIGVGVEMAKLPAKLRDFGAAILEAKRPLAELSGTIAAAYMELDADRFRRNVRLAQQTGGSTSSLAKAQSRLEEKLLPFQTAFTNFANTVQEKMIQGVEMLIEIGKQVPLVGRAIEKWSNDQAKKDQKQTLVDLSQKIADGVFDKRRNPPLPPLR